MDLQLAIQKSRLSEIHKRILSKTYRAYKFRPAASPQATNPPPLIFFFLNQRTAHRFAESEAVLWMRKFRLRSKFISTITAQLKIMSYMQETDDWLTAILAAGPEDNEPEEEWFKRIKKQIKDRILESYKNGQKAALRSAAVSWPTEDSQEKEGGKGTKKAWFNRRKARNG